MQLTADEHLRCKQFGILEADYLAAKLAVHRDPTRTVSIPVRKRVVIYTEPSLGVIRGPASKVS
jgi:hypothetical protein